jgi:hypothetical protein
MKNLKISEINEDNSNFEININLTKNEKIFKKTSEAREINNINQCMINPKITINDDYVQHLENNYNEHKLNDNLEINEHGYIEENFQEEIRKRLYLCENTLPGFLISLMVKKGEPMSETELFDEVFPKIGNFRKPDGSKYKVITIIVYF